MKFVLIILVFIFLNNNSYCRIFVDSFPKSCHHLATNSYQCDWSFFTIDKIITARIIDYTKFTRRCGIEITASICIVAHENDTFRVILKCCNNSLKKGQIIHIRADREPTFDIGVPIDLKFLQITYKRGNPVWRINKYDSIILKTTWGALNYENY